MGREEFFKSFFYGGVGGVSECESGSLSLLSHGVDLPLPDHLG